jgi:hypothetical protein
LAICLHFDVRRHVEISLARFIFEHESSILFFPLLLPPGHDQDFAYHTANGGFARAH